MKLEAKTLMTERKAQHLEICTRTSMYTVEGDTSGFDRYRFLHRALPELALKDLDTSLPFLGSKLDMPFFISSMTGGSDEGYELNKILARLAAAYKIPVGMGSIRILFRKPEVLPHFMLKDLAPDVPVVANLGAVQIRDMVHGNIIELLKRLRVDALAIHLNPAQELFQEEGDRDFSGIIDGIARFCASSPIPVIVKETGCGIGPHDAMKLLQAGAAYVNIAGSGGTNWAIVESYRTSPLLAKSAQDFTSWGLPTTLVLAALRELEATSRVKSSGIQARSVHQTKAIHAADSSLSKEKKNKSQYKGLLNGRILASGGIRSGHDIAVALALGAYCAGTALPLIRAVRDSGFEAGAELIESYKYSLRSIMLLTGSQTLAQLRTQPLLVEPGWQAYTEQFVRTMGLVQ